MQEGVCLNRPARHNDTVWLVAGRRHLFTRGSSLTTPRERGFKPSEAPPECRQWPWRFHCGCRLSGQAQVDRIQSARQELLCHQSRYVGAVCLSHHNTVDTRYAWLGVNDVSDPVAPCRQTKVTIQNYLFDGKEGQFQTWT